MKAWLRPVLLVVSSSSIVFLSGCVSLSQYDPLVKAYRSLNSTMVSNQQSNLDNNSSSAANSSSNNQSTTDSSNASQSSSQTTNNDPMQAMNQSMATASPQLRDSYQADIVAFVKANQTQKQLQIGTLDHLDNDPTRALAIGRVLYWNLPKPGLISRQILIDYLTHNNSTAFTKQAAVAGVDQINKTDDQIQQRFKNDHVQGNTTNFDALYQAQAQHDQK